MDSMPPHSNNDMVYPSRGYLPDYLDALDKRDVVSEIISYVNEIYEDPNNPDRHELFKNILNEYNKRNKTVVVAR